MVVSTGLALVSAVVVVGTLVVPVVTSCIEVTTVVFGLVVTAGTGVRILRSAVVEAILGPVVSTFGGVVVNTV